MRSIWNGTISFGLVSIPIKMYAATEDSHTVSFKQIHTADQGRIRYRKVCELEDEPVAPDEIGRAYEDADGSLIPITEDDLAALPLPTTHTLEIEAFVPASEIDPLQMADAYYLGANGAAAAKPYVLLREALKRGGKVAIAKYAHRGRERLGMLRVVDDTLTLHRLVWPDEVRDSAGMAPTAKVSVREAELDLADTLMATLGEVDPESLHDEYHQALEEMVAAKVSGAAPAAEAEAPPETGQIVDLMAALQDSVRSARRSRGGTAEEAGTDEEGAGATVTALRGRRSAAGTAEKKAPARRAAGDGKRTADGGKPAARKTPPKKTAAKKTTTKKTTAGSTGSTAKDTGRSAGASAAKSTAGTASKTTGKTAAKTAPKTAAKSASKTASKSTAKKTASGRRTRKAS
ncbi:Ku protein [Streptomyces pactum]|uniref:Non-homologous end joining protein Ku n=1 Tax=Streptomyces pactum TaxID=68249 RepID=A0ABS0NJA2_9ACTN|nr:Ku protein [Streptomyces pactum]MBH5335277.1 Ku protein [Streptomyces pactum]